jgi:hypothetical protein
MIRFKFKRIGPTKKRLSPELRADPKVLSATQREARRLEGVDQ